MVMIAFATSLFAGIFLAFFKELAEFRAWFEEFNAQAWDRQFSGRLDKVAKKAIEDFNKEKIWKREK